MPAELQTLSIRTLFAKRLKAFRVPRGFATARSFANALGIDENRYTRYERAEVEPDLSLLIKICSLLAVKPNDLLDFETDQTSSPGFSEEPTQPLRPTTDPTSRNSARQASVLQSALSWRMAELVADLNRADPANKLDRVGRIARLYTEIDANPFAFVAGIATNPRLVDLSPEATASFAELAEALIAAAKDTLVL